MTLSLWLIRFFLDLNHGNGAEAKKQKKTSSISPKYCVGNCLEQYVMIGALRERERKGRKSFTSQQVLSLRKSSQVEQLIYRVSAPFLCIFYTNHLTVLLANLVDLLPGLSRGTVKGKKKCRKRAEKLHFYGGKISISRQEKWPPFKIFRFLLADRRFSATWKQSYCNSIAELSCNQKLRPLAQKIKFQFWVFGLRKCAHQWQFRKPLSPCKDGPTWEEIKAVLQSRES